MEKQKINISKKRDLKSFLKQPEIPRNQLKKIKGGIIGEDISGL